MTLDLIIENIFKNTIFSVVFDYPPYLNKSTYQSAHDIFQSELKNHHIDLEKQLNHELLSRLILTTKLKIGALFSPECYIAMGILSVLIENKAFKDELMVDKKNYSPYQHIIGSEYIKMYEAQYSLYNYEAWPNIKNDTYFFNLSEICLVINEFQNGRTSKISDSFLIESAHLLNNFIENIPMSSKTLKEYLKHPDYLKSVKKTLSQEKNRTGGSKFVNELDSILQQVDTIIEKKIVETSLKNNPLVKTKTVKL
jgi:hypothetical protein